MLAWGALAYALLGIAACAASWLWLDRMPLSHPEPWLALPEEFAWLYSVLLGAAFGSLIVVLSRVSVGRFRWAQRLHREFRPVARQLSTSGIVMLALLSGLAEELLFRGLLQPWLGLVPQAILFGVVHQTRGPSRWVWAGWAALVGLGLGVIFQATGSLWGAVVAHAVINAMNLSYLKHHDLEPARPALGGLLGRREGSAPSARS